MLNQVFIAGTLTRNPELKQTRSGTALCELRLNVPKRKKDGDQWTEEDMEIEVTVFNRQAENAALYLTTGAQVFVQGSIDTWTTMLDNGSNVIFNIAHDKDGGMWMIEMTTVTTF